MKNTAVIHRTAFAPHYYNVRILTSGYYYGIGRFCETLEEAAAFMNLYNVAEWRWQK